MRKNIVHVYPVGVTARGIEHETSGEPCPCVPEVKQVCSQCSPKIHCPDEEGQPVEAIGVLLDCWKCNGKGIHPRDEDADDDAPLIIVHNA